MLKLACRTLALKVYSLLIGKRIVRIVTVLSHSYKIDPPPLPPPRPPPRPPPLPAPPPPLLGGLLRPPSLSPPNLLVTFCKTLGIDMAPDTEDFLNGRNLQDCWRCRCPGTQHNHFALPATAETLALVADFDDCVATKGRSRSRRVHSTFVNKDDLKPLGALASWPLSR